MPAVPLCKAGCSQPLEQTCARGPTAPAVCVTVMGQNLTDRPLWVRNPLVPELTADDSLPPAQLTYEGSSCRCLMEMCLPQMLVPWCLSSQLMTACHLRS